MIYRFFFFFLNCSSVPRANVTLSITWAPNMVASYITTGNNKHEMTALNKASVPPGCTDAHSSIAAAQQFRLSVSNIRANEPPVSEQ